MLMNFELPPEDDRLLWDTWLSIYRMPVLTIADELGIFTTLAAQPMTAAVLARQLETHGRAMEILLPMLTAMGLLQVESGNYQLTPISRHYLLPDNPCYWGGVLDVVRATSPYHQALKELVCKQTHSPAAPDHSARDTTRAWEQGSIDAARARRMAWFMQSQSQPAALGLSAMLDLNAVTRLLDVGGGSACYSIALARKFPALRCTVLDLDAMCRIAQEYISRGGVSDRVDTLALDMFRDPWPQGYDAVLFSNVFHDWDAATCRQLAARAYDALPPGGNIYLHEMLLHEDGVGPLTVNAFSMLMLLGNDGHQFTATELQQLLEQAGFSDLRTTPAYGYYSLTVGRK